MLEQYRRAPHIRVFGLRLSVLLLSLLFALMTSGCGSSSSDTQSAVRGAESFGLRASITSPNPGVEVRPGESLIFSTAPDGGVTPYTYSWSFPNGNPLNSTDQSVTVTFSEAGVQNVTLTVSDANGNSTTDALNVTVTNNPALAASITSPNRPLSISAGSSVAFNGIATGGSGEYTYSWTFPGGTPANASGQSADVVFNSAGSFTVIFSVVDSNGTSNSDTVTITVSDTAVTSVNATITSPATDLTTTTNTPVNLSGTASGGTGSYSYRWDIPGGSVRTATTRDVNNVTFANAGVYLVTFTVTDSSGNTASDTVQITVNQAQITATITFPGGGSITITQGDTIDFSASASGGVAPYTYNWSIPNGTPSSATGQNPPTITFNSVSTATTTLTVTDSNGDTGTDSIVVEVTP